MTAANLKYFFWPARYIRASILCSFGGFLFGMDTSIIGPVTVMDQYLAAFGGTASATVHGLIVSSILIPAAIASFFTGRLADAVGRTKAISIGGLIFGIGAALEAASVHIAMFVVGRVIEGVGEGIFLGNLVVYICEISPPHQRGPLTSGPQLTNTIGLVIGFFTCYGSRTINSSLAWRLPFVLLALCSFLFAAAALRLMPESPRWLIEHGREDEAARSWDMLGVKHEDREQIESEDGRADILLTDITESGSNEALQRTQIAQTARSAAAAKRKDGMLAAFAPEVRSRTILGVFILGMQQMSGIDGVLYYAPTLFEKAGLTSPSTSFLASGGSALVIFAVTVPALIWCDKMGRRPSTIFGGLGITLFMFLIGSLYAADAVKSDGGAGRYIVIASVYLFAAVFCVTWSISIKIFVAESQPQRSRAAATGLAHGSNWVTNFLVALTTPVILNRTSFGAYFLFGGCTLLTAIVCIIWMPETKGKSLREIDAMFSQKSPGLKAFTKSLLKRV